MPTAYCQAILFTAALAAVATAAETTVYSFDEEPEGTLPAGWTAAKTREGPGSVWKIVVYDSGGQMGPALAQTSSEGPSSLFNICVLKEVKCVDVDVDVDLSVRVKAINGVHDRGGGLVWRYRDANNYYVTAGIRWRTTFASIMS